ncbi:hypothetical protein V2J09_001347 [Rumex salicifolius]
MSLGDLIIDDRDGPEHELLEAGSLGELASCHKWLAAATVVDDIVGCPSVLNDIVGLLLLELTLTVHAGEEGGVVVVD